MDRVKFYSNSDMTTAYNFNKAIEIAETIIDKDYTIWTYVKFLDTIFCQNPPHLNLFQFPFDKQKYFY